MSNVRAGVAYVDVRLGSVEEFKKRFKEEVESVVAPVTKRVGEEMAKKMAPEGTKVGKAGAQTMTKAFFEDANSSMLGGFRALSQGQIRIFGSMMKEAGVAGALGIKDGFLNALDRSKAAMNNAVKSLGAGISNAASSMTTGLVNAFKSIPTHIARAGESVDSFSKRLGFLSFQLTNFGFIASTAFTAPVAAIVGLGALVGIQTASQIENATAALKSLTPAGTDIEALIKRLQKLAQESPIFNSADLITFTQRMAASGLTIKETEEFLKSFGNIALTVGADVSKIPFALEALVQMAGKGKVSMEELRLQLGDALPGTMTIVSKALGVTTDELYKMVEAGELTGKELIAALTKIGQSEKYLQGAANGAQTMSAKWQALKESVQNQLGEVFLKHSKEIQKALDDLGPVLSDLITELAPVFPAVIKGIGDLVKKIGELVNWYKNLDKPQQDLVNKLMLAAIVLGPLVLVLGTLGAAIAGITALVAAILTPVGAVVAALILFGIEAWSLINYLKGLYKEGGKFKETWDSIWNSVMTLIQPIREEFSKLWEELKKAFDQIKNSLSSVQGSFSEFLPALKVIAGVIVVILGTALAVIFGVIKGVVAAIGPLVNAIASFIGGIIKIIGGLITFIVGVFTGDWQKALDGLKLIWDGLWDAIVGTLANLGKAILELVKGIFTGIIDFAKWLYDVMVGHSIIPDLVNAIIEWFLKLVNKGKALFSELGRFFSEFYGTYIKPFVDKIRSGISDVVSYMSSIPGKIKNAVGDLGSLLYGAGKDLINGLINGVKSMGRTLTNAILSLIPGPVRGVVESALGISSPSKVFEKYGKFTVLGFIEGVENREAALKSSVSSTFGNLVPETVRPYYGDPRNPAVDSRSAGSALTIENYYTNEKDPNRVAEDWWFMVTARGGAV